MNKLPTLYTKTATGAVQQWTVSHGAKQVERPLGTLNAGLVSTTYGQVGGKLQTTEDVILHGKNLGKKNETTPVQQAELKAKQLWDKKVKEGYVEDLDKAAAGETDLPGIEPMLAHPIEDKEKYATFPAYCQPKLDGFRCIAMIANGDVKLFSRTRKTITTLPHIVFQLSEMFRGQTLILDGELYNHELKDDFSKIASTIKRDEVHPDHEIIQYHVYDVVGSGDQGYNARTKAVFELLSSAKAPNVKVVDTYYVNSREELGKMHDRFTALGYEGAMYRNVDTPYEMKRSPGLLKVKKFSDAEFTVVDRVEGSGKFMGKLGAFVCVTPKGQRFNVAMNGTIESLEEYLVNFDLYANQPLTVQFQGLTPDGIPRFPRGLRFREDI
jgi:DNA ligase-1